jgi:hypothetical protein
MFSAMALSEWSEATSHVEARVPRRVSSSRPRAYFLLGQSTAGSWVVRDHDNRKGGAFVSQKEALKYIRRESDAVGQFVVVYLPRGLELEPK